MSRATRTLTCPPELRRVDVAFKISVGILIAVIAPLRIEKAKLDQEGKPKLRWHDLRHTAISGPIADGIPLSTIARIAGHANTAITGRVYAHEIERAEQGDRAREAMERRRGNRWATEGQNQRENEAVWEARKWLF